MERSEIFEVERPRLVRLAAGVLNDHAEAQDAVQEAWLRVQRSDADIHSLPAWLTTVTTRLCLDRLRARIPTPTATITVADGATDPADDVALAETVGVALQRRAP